MNRQLKIQEKYLNELLEFWSKTVVGKVMKRFELFDDKSLIKKDTKEIIYEESRHLRDLMVAHSAGLDMAQFQFQNRKES